MRLPLSIFLMRLSDAAARHDADAALSPFRRRYFADITDAAAFRCLSLRHALSFQRFAYYNVCAPLRCHSSLPLAAAIHTLIDTMLFDAFDA